MRLLSAVVLISALYGESAYRAVGSNEIELIIERLIHRESRGESNPPINDEGSVGLMQMTPIALREVNSWAGTKYTMADMRSASNCRWAGSYFLTNIILRYRCNWNIIQAVAAYNVGISNVGAGIYPDDYLRSIIPWWWNFYRQGFNVSGKWRDRRSGAWLVEIRGIDGKPPRLGL